MTRVDIADKDKSPAEERAIPVNLRAYEKLTKAKKEGESYSDVIIRLTSTTLEGLQRRGEMEIVTTEGKKLKVRIEQGKCLGAMSCVALAPKVFALDISQLGLSRHGADEPLGMRDVLEGEVDGDTLVRAAQSCPYKAIYVRDEEGELILP
jgi:predicted CopG family antitoxin